MANIDEIEVELSKLNNHKKTTRQKLIYFSMSFILFISLGFLTFNIHDLLILAIIILVHELGHVMAMKYFGYYDLNMFFIPFLGGAASGKQNTSDGTEQAIVSLMGPLVGMVGGFVAWLFYLSTNWEPLSKFAMLSFLVNAFNLLPIFPLDGGKFFDAVLFARVPTLETLIRILATIILIFLAFLLQSPLFGVIAFLSFMTIISISFQNKIIKRLNIKPGFITDINSLSREQIETLSKGIAEQSNNYQHSAKIVALNIHAICRKISFLPPTVATSGMLLVLYLTFFSVGTIGPFINYIQHNKPKVEVVKKRLPDGRMVNVQVHYFNDKKINEAQLDHNGLFDGPAVKWDIGTGKKVKESYNKNGYWHGPAKSYDPTTGKLINEVVFDTGKPIKYSEIQDGQLVELSEENWPSFLKFVSQREPAGSEAFHK